jgi:hypothetical protein
MIKNPIQADATSCYYVVSHETKVNGLHLGCFHVEFWLEAKKDFCPFAFMVVHAPAQWAADYFFCNVPKKNKPFAFNTINKMQYLFKDRYQLSQAEEI